MRIEGIDIEVSRKAIKTIRVAVKSPDGRVCMSAPLAVPDSVLTAFIAQRLDWIREHRSRILARAAPRRPDYLDGETLRLFGKDVILRIVAGRGRPKARLLAGGDLVELAVDEGRSGAPAPTMDEKGRAERAKAIESLYRAELSRLIPDLLLVWEARLKVKAEDWGLRRMKTRWGSCNPRARRICLNIELGRRPPSCLEYVLVHELAHLLESGHGPAFKAILDANLPDWRLRRKLLAEESIPDE